MNYLLKSAAFLVLSLLCLVFMALIVYEPSGAPADAENPFEIQALVDSNDWTQEGGN